MSKKDQAAALARKQRILDRRIAKAYRSAGFHELRPPCDTPGCENKADISERRTLLCALHYAMELGITHDMGLG